MLPESPEHNGWTPHLWEELETFAREVVDRHAKLRHLIPRAPDRLGAYTIETPKAERDERRGWSRNLDSASAPTHRWSSFTIKAEQVGDVQNLKALVELPPRPIAADEDRVLFDELLLVNEKREQTKSPVSTTVREAVGAIEAGAAAANADNMPFSGPCVLAWHAARWGEEIDGSTERYARGQRDAVIQALGVGGSIVRVPGTESAGSAPAYVAAKKYGKSEGSKNDAVVFARDSFGLDLVYATHPTITYCGHVDDGLKFRVEQRFILRIHNAGCCITLIAPPLAEKTGA